MTAITLLLLASFFPSAAAAQPPVMAASNGSQQSRVPSSYTPLDPAEFLSMAVYKLDPIYPETAKQDSISGYVRAYLIVDLDGNVAQVDLQSGEPLLADAAVAALQQWHFAPYKNRNGQPYAVGSSVLVNFHSDGKISYDAPSVGVLRAILKEAPDDWMSRNDLASALRKQNDIDGAIAEYLKLLETKPNLLPQRWTLAGLYWNEKDWPKAAEQWRLYISRDTHPNGSAEQELARVSEKMGDWDGAITLYRRVLEKYPRPDTIMWLGLALYGKGNSQEAAQSFRDVLAGRTDAAFQHASLCRMLPSERPPDDAIAQCRESLELQSTGGSAALAHAALGEALERKGDLKKSVAELRIAVEMMPANNSFRQSLQRVSSSLGVSPNVPGAPDASTLNSAPSPTPAPAAILPAVSSSFPAAFAPDEYAASPNAKAEFNSAVQALQSKFYQAADMHFKSVLASNPDYPAANWFAAQVAFGLDLYSDAIVLLKKYQQLAPNDWRPHEPLVYAYARTDQKTERDVNRQELRDLRRSGKYPELNSLQCYPLDTFQAGGRTVNVTEFFELTGRFGYKYYFDVLNSEGKIDYRIALESDAGDQPLFAKEHPTEAAAGARRFSLDTYGPGNTQGLIRFFDGEPNYDAVKAMAQTMVGNSSKPPASSSPNAPK
jgi:TonB family protein